MSQAKFWWDDHGLLLHLQNWIQQANLPNYEEKAHLPTDLKEWLQDFKGKRECVSHFPFPALLPVPRKVPNKAENSSHTS